MIGVFDSGVGGLSVLSEIRKTLPEADLVYLADQGRAPYGVRTLAELSEISVEVSGWLLERGASVITVACNTASAAALHRLRQLHPEVPFVGMEPAVKPAALATSSGVIGVVATAATFQGELFASVVQRHADGLKVVTRACPAWVELVEKGDVDGPEALARVDECLRPILDAGADAIVLGCTHFPFLAPLIERVAGPDVAILDPAPAVAQQVKRVAAEETGSGSLTMATSGDPIRFAEMAWRLAGIESSQPVLAWSRNEV